ncbi:MAG: hypothetical protein EOL97_09055 [Spirochaetia bacterium]|nr:hypothetical protein [Spirochaetia bacterium]
MKTLKEVRNYLDSIPGINAGGCLFSAYAMYLWLEKNNKLTKNTAIVLNYRDDDRLEFDINHSILTNNNNLHLTQSCAHAMLFHRKRFIDSEKSLTSPPSRYILQLSTTNKQFILGSLKNEDNWNSMFDRRWVQWIEKKLEITLT